MSRFTAAEIEQRAQGIGGSEAAAALGLSNTVTPIDLYRHKVYGEPLPINADEMALWLGHQLEPVCAAAFEKHTGMERLWGPDGSDDVPMPVLCQSVHYMIASQFDCWHVGVLLGTEFRAYTIYPSDEVVNMVIEGERKFWQHVEDQVAPPAINVRDLHYLYRRARPDSTRAATKPEIELHKQLWQAKSQHKNIETRINNLEFELKKGLKDTARLTHPDNDNHVLVNWRDHRKRVANSTALKKFGLWDAYSNEIDVRPMLLGDPM